AIELLATVPAKRRIAVIGPMDAPPRPRRPAYRTVGMAVGQAADVVIVVGTYWESYWSGLRDGGLARATAPRVETVAEAAALLRLMDLGEGDVVLLKARYAQKFARIALLLQGQDVRCELVECSFERMNCEVCPLLSRHPLGATAQKGKRAPSP